MRWRIVVFWLASKRKQDKGENACSIDRPLESSSAACFQASKIVAEKRRAVMHQKPLEKGLACLEAFGWYLPEMACTPLFFFEAAE